jgi:hypothetical protein
MCILDKGDDPHLSFTFGALKGIHFIDSLYARGPIALTELTAIVALWFFRGRRGELSAFASAPTGIPSVISGYGFVGLRYMT